MWERKKEKRKMFKEKNENEERKVFEGKIRFQKQKKSNFSAFLLPLTAFQTKVFQRCCCVQTPHNYTLE